MANDELFQKIFSDAIEIKNSIESQDLNQELRDLEDRYVIKDLIGEGAVKEVFFAYDKMMDREVAIAKIKKESSDQINDFLNEARLSSNLEHPYIAPVYDLGFDKDGSPFFVMKLYDGKNLREELLLRQKQNLELKDEITWVLNIYLKVCEALSFAHSKGILHLDIKPSNIRIDNFGEVLLCDWGIARYIHSYDLSEDSDLSISENLLSRATLTGQVRGTPGFMAPEQKTKDKQFDERTDIFGLGALLQDMLTGSPQFSDSESDMPQELKAICQKSLSPQQSDRYRNVQELIDDVNKYQSGKVTTAENANLFSVFKKWCWRHRKPIFITALNLIIFAGLITLYIRDINASKESLKTAVNELKTQELKINSENIARAKNYFEQGYSAYCNAVSDFDYDKDDIELAKKLLLKSTELNPGDSKAWALLGKLRINQYDFKIALEDFSKAGQEYKENYWDIINKHLPDLGSKQRSAMSTISIIHDFTYAKKFDRRLRNHLIFKGIHSLKKENELIEFSIESMKTVNKLSDITHTYNAETKSLDLKKNEINILYPLKTLRINKLNLSHNPMWNTEFFNLRRIPLTHLDVSYCKLIAINRFANPEIEYLNLEGNPLESILSVTKTGIKTINIAHTRVRLDQLKKCKKLENVICSQDQYQELKKILDKSIQITVKK
ncbi:MAG: serine/threonine protein kinase [Lentisphaeraceae bacterium]|nr:serine/threonine protein kinase [Lentisphaeraceae bacterium]